MMDTSDRLLRRLRSPCLGLGLRLGLGGSNRGAVNFDLTPGTLPSGMTLTRASTGTYTDVAGVMQSAAINAARFDYSPSSVGTLLGLLLEPARTNIALRSDALDNAYWDSKTSLSVTANAIASPDGTTNAEKLVEAAATSEHSLARSNISASNATIYTHSFYTKAGERTALKIGDIFGFTTLAFFINLSTGATSGKTGGSAGATLASLNAGGGWFRTSAQDTTDHTAVDPLFALVSTGTTFIYAGDGTSGAYIWGVQIEQGAGATSYIPTAAASVTRAADVCTFNIPPGVFTLRYTFDDDSTQDVSVTPGSYTIPTNLNRSRIKRIVSL
jgi:hypothetical protein